MELQIKSAVISLLVIIQFFFSPIEVFARGFTSDERANELRPNIVKIEVRVVGRAEVSNGFGIIISTRGEKLLVVTADHVVRRFSKDPDAEDPDIQITFFNDRGRSYPAELLATRVSSMDLAVVETSAPSGLDWKRECLGSTLYDRLRGVKVSFIGMHGDWHVPATPGTINELASDGRFKVDNLGIELGSSGGALVSANGIIGMITSDRPGAVSYALPITEIENLVKNWGYPWELRRSAEGREKDAGPSAKEEWISTALIVPVVAAAIYFWNDNESKKHTHVNDPANDKKWNDYVTSYNLRWISVSVAAAQIGLTGTLWYLHRGSSNRHKRLSTGSFPVSVGVGRDGSRIVFTYRF